MQCLSAFTQSPVNKRTVLPDACSHPVMKTDEGQTKTYSWETVFLQHTISVWELHVNGTLLTVYHPLLVAQAWEQTLFSPALLFHYVLVKHARFYDNDLRQWHTGSAAQPNLFWFSWLGILQGFIGMATNASPHIGSVSWLLWTQRKQLPTASNAQLLLGSEWCSTNGNIVVMWLSKFLDFVWNKLFIFGGFEFCYHFLRLTKLFFLKRVTRAFYQRHFGENVREAYKSRNSIFLKDFVCMQYK